MKLPQLCVVYNAAGVGFLKVKGKKNLTTKPLVSQLVLLQVTVYTDMLISTEEIQNATKMWKKSEVRGRIQFAMLLNSVCTCCL